MTSLLAVGAALAALGLGWWLGQRHGARNLRRSEALLRERERQLAGAQAIAHVGSWEWDIPSNVVTWSDELYRLMGVPPEQTASYEAFVAHVHPDDRERVEAVVARGLTELHTVEFEWRLVRPDGGIRHMFGRNIVIVNEAGQAVRMAGTSLDITDRKSAEEELRAALGEVETLRGLIRICAHCKRVLTDSGTWQQIESYVRERSPTEFTHGICPDCAQEWADSRL